MTLYANRFPSSAGWLFGLASFLVACGGGNGGGDQSPVTPPDASMPVTPPDASMPVTPPDASLPVRPTSPTALAAQSQGSYVWLSWTPPAIPLSGYTVYRGRGGDCQNLESVIVAGSPTAVGTSDDLNDYVDPDDPNGGTLAWKEYTYCYRVSASGVGGEGPRSAAALVTAVWPNYSMENLVNFAADSASASEIVLSWDALGDGGGIASYNVYRCLVPPDDAQNTCATNGVMGSDWIGWVPPSDSARLRYADSVSAAAGSTARYAVGAQRAGVDAGWVYFDVVANAAPRFPDGAAVGDLVFVQGQTITPLRLPQAVGGDDGYDISFQPTLPTGLEFDSQTSVLSGTPTNSAAKETHTMLTHDGDSYLDVSKDADTLEFTVTVLASDGGGAEVSSAPSSPTALVAQASPVSVRLSWSAPATPLSGYTVYGGDRDCAGMTEQMVGPVGPTETTVQIDVTTDATYCYQVSAKNDFGEGPRSATAVVTATDAKMPVGLMAASASRSEIVLNWNAPADDGGGPLGGYNVYRCTDDDDEADGITCRSSGVGQDDWIAWVLPSDDLRWVDGISTPGTTAKYVVAAERNRWGSPWAYLDIVANAAPRFPAGAAVGDLVFVQGQAITPLRLPQAVGGDDGYDISFQPTLPAGLEFDSQTSVLSGTPESMSERTVYTLLAHDGDGDTTDGDADSLDFSIAVTAAQ